MISAGPAEAPSNGVAFRHIACGQSAIDRLWENNGGFSSFGDYARTASIVQASRAGYMSATDSEREKYEAWSLASSAYRGWLAERDYPAVARAVSSPDGMFENTDPDGGALIPPGFVREIFDKARFNDTPMSRCRTIVVGTNAGVMPMVAEKSRVNGSRWGGILSYWENEAQQLMASHPTLENAQYRLKKLTALVPASEELLQDSSLLDGFVTEVVSEEFRYRTNDALINGTGSGQILGIVNAPGTITITKDTGQATGTLSASNIQNMWTQSHGASRENMVWYAQEDIDPDTLGLPVTQPTAWGGPQPCPHVKGRPFLPLENCQPIGTPGDVVLADWSQVVLLLSGMRKTVSMHFKFDYFEGYMRFVWRADAQPLWQSSLVPPHSTIAKSAYLVVAQR